MKSTKQPEVKTEILERLERLKPESERQWGKMNPSQMLEHCAAQLKLALGEIKGKPKAPQFILSLIKNVMLRVKWSKNLPTAPEMVISNPKEFEQSKQEFLKTFEAFDAKPAESNWEIHPIFGKLSKDEWGKVAYKHIDHHWRQFGV